MSRPILVVNGVVVQVKVRSPVFNKMRRIAYQENRSISAVVRLLIDDALEYREYKRRAAASSGRGVDGKRRVDAAGLTAAE